MADKKTKGETVEPKRMSKRKAKSKTKKRSDSGEDSSMEVSAFRNLDLGQHNATGGSNTHALFNPPQQQMMQHGQPFVPPIASQNVFVKPAVPPQQQHRTSASSHLQQANSQLQQRQRHVATAAPHQRGTYTAAYHQSQTRQHHHQQSASVYSGFVQPENRMRGENPEAWLGGGLGGMVRQGILTADGGDVELGANVEVASSDVTEGMEIDNDEEPSGGGQSLMSLEPPAFLQDLSGNQGFVVPSQGDGSSMEQLNVSEDFWNQINADNGSLLTSFLSSHSSGEQPISLGTVLDVLGITDEQAHEVQINPHQQGATGVETAEPNMVLNNQVVMWAPPDHAQDYIKQQESLLGQPGQPIVSSSSSSSSPSSPETQATHHSPLKRPLSQVTPPPLPYPAAASIPVPQAKSALEVKQQTFSGISASGSAACVTRAATSTTDGMSTSDDSAGCGIVASPKLPEYYEMIVRGYYRQQEVYKILVENEEGCVLFYKQPKKTPGEDLSSLTMVEFPNVNEQTGMSEKTVQYTKKVTDVMEKGVLIQERDGFIYATRRCRSKVFVCSSQDKIGESKELQRDEETVVFNPYLFEKRYRKWLLKGLGGGSKRVSRPKTPNIVFTFAQRWSWNSHHPLMTCLVYAVVSPMRPRTQLAWGPGNTEQDDSLNRDYSSGMLQISTPSQSSSSSGGSHMASN